MIAVFLAFIFSLSAIGMEVNVHHCMGKNSYTFFGIDFNKHCQCKHDSKQHKSSCCNNHRFLLKTVNDNFTTSTQLIVFNKINLYNFLIAPSPVCLFSLVNQAVSKKYLHLLPDRGIPLYTLHQVFRI